MNQEIKWSELTKAEFDALPMATQRAVPNEQWQLVMDALSADKTVRIEVENEDDARRKTRSVIRHGLVRGIQIEVRSGDGFIAATKTGEVSAPARAGSRMAVAV